MSPGALLGRLERDEGTTGGLVRGGHDDLRFVGGGGTAVVRLKYFSVCLRGMSSTGPTKCLGESSTRLCVSEKVLCSTTKGRCFFGRGPLLVGNERLLNEVRSFFSECVSSTSERLSPDSKPLRLESKRLFAESEGLLRERTARSMTNLVAPIYLSAEGALSSDGLQHLRDRLEPRPCTHAHEGRLRRPGAPPVPTSFCTARRPGNLTRLSCEDRCLVRSQILSRMRRRHGRRCAIARGQVVLAIRREHIQHDRRLQRPRLMLDPASQDETVTASDLEHFGPAAET